MVPFVISGDSLTVYVRGKPHSVGRTHPNYEKIKQGLRGLTENELFELIDIPEHIKRSLVDHKVEVKADTIYVDGQPIRNAMATRLLEFIEQDFPVENLVKFIENIYKNPSDESIADLYVFLEKNSLPITENGSFLAYKVVDKNYRAKHPNLDGTYNLNTIGQHVPMPREQVDPDRNKTCSTGLHVCSLDYVGTMKSVGDRVMVTEVYPQHVVSVPIDYNGAKMRVCDYVVVGELTDDKTIKDTSVGSHDYAPANENRDSTEREKFLEKVAIELKAYARSKKVGLWKVLSTEGQRRKTLEHIGLVMNVGTDFINNCDLIGGWDEDDVIEALVEAAEDRNLFIDED